MKPDCLTTYGTLEAQNSTRLLSNTQGPPSSLLEQTQKTEGMFVYAIRTKRVFQLEFQTSKLQAMFRLKCITPFKLIPCGKILTTTMARGYSIFFAVRR